MLPETLTIGGRKPEVKTIDGGKRWYVIDGGIGGAAKYLHLDGAWHIAAGKDGHWPTEAEAEAAAYLAADLPPGFEIRALHGVVGVWKTCYGMPYLGQFAAPAEAYSACWAAAREACPNRETVADEPQGWRDIATAPRDGTHVLLYSPERCGNCSETSTGVSSSYWQNGWMVARLLSGELIGVNHQPTHWHALPAPPQEQPDASKPSR